MIYDVASVETMWPFKEAEAKRELMVSENERVRTLEKNREHKSKRQHAVLDYDSDSSQFKDVYTVFQTINPSLRLFSLVKEQEGHAHPRTLHSDLEWNVHQSLAHDIDFCHGTMSTSNKQERLSEQWQMFIAVSTSNLTPWCWMHDQELATTIQQWELNLDIYTSHVWENLLHMWMASYPQGWVLDELTGEHCASNSIENVSNEPTICKASHLWVALFHPSSQITAWLRFNQACVEGNAVHNSSSNFNAAHNFSFDVNAVVISGMQLTIPATIAMLLRFQECSPKFLLLFQCCCDIRNAAQNSSFDFNAVAKSGMQLTIPASISVLQQFQERSSQFQLQVQCSCSTML